MGWRRSNLLFNGLSWASSFCDITFPIKRRRRDSSIYASGTALMAKALRSKLSHFLTCKGLELKRGEKISSSLCCWEWCMQARALILLLLNDCPKLNSEEWTVVQWWLELREEWLSLVERVTNKEHTSKTLFFFFFFTRRTKAADWIISFADISDW